MMALVRALALAASASGAMVLLGVSVRDLIRVDRGRRRAAPPMELKRWIETLPAPEIRDGETRKDGKE